MSWKQYWSNDHLWSQSNLWEINSRLFFHQLRCIFPLNKNQKVLSLGCGAGHIENKLAGEVAEIHGLDVSESLLKKCEERCSVHRNIRLTHLSQDYTDMSFIDEKYDLIIAVSVLQYYSGLDEVKALLESVKALANPGATFIIGDLPLKRSTIEQVKDSVSSFFLSIKKGYWASFLKIMIKSFFSGDYSRAKKGNGELLFEFDTLKSLLSETQLKGEFVFEPVSIVSNRPSLIISLNPVSSPHEEQLQNASH